MLDIDESTQYLRVPQTPMVLGRRPALEPSEKYQRYPQ